MDTDQFDLFAPKGLGQPTFDCFTGYISMLLTYILSYLATTPCNVVSSLFGGCVDPYGKYSQRKIGGITFEILIQTQFFS